MNVKSKCSPPVVVPFADGSDIAIPDELVHVLLIMVSVSLACYGVDILKKLLSEGSNEKVY